MQRFLLLLFLLLPFSTLLYAQEWIKEHPVPSNSKINAIHFSNANLGWWVGTEGALLVSANGGQNWTLQATPTNVDLYGLTFLDEQEGWLVGAEGTILHTTTGGNDWQTQATFSNAILAKVQFLDAQNGWIMSGLDSILRTTNGGQTWQTYAVAPSVSLKDFEFINHTTGWVCGDTSIWKTTDGGQTWVEQLIGGAAALESLDFVDENNGWLVGADGATYRTTNGGATWSTHVIPIASNYTLLGVHFQDSLNGITFRDYMILKTEDGGITWDFLTGGRYKQLFFLDTMNVWGIVQNNYEQSLWGSTNGVQNFAMLFQTDRRSLTDIAVLNKEELWAVGTAGQLYSEDGGRVWNQRGTGVSNPCYEVEFSEDGQKGWMISTWLRIYSTIDGGDTWQRSQSLGTGIITEQLYALNFVNDQTGWVGSSYGTIYKTSNGGQAWQSVATGFLETKLLEFASSQTGWMTDANGTHKTIDGGNNWTIDPVFNHTNLTALHFIDSLSGWAGGIDSSFNTILLYTNNAGNTWVKDTLLGVGIIAELHFASATKGWLTNNNDEIWMTENGGQTWTIQYHSTTPIHALGAADSIHAWTAGDQSNILRYQNCTMLTPVINNNGGTLNTTGAYTTYQWLLNGDSILGATQANYTPNVEGVYSLIVHDGLDCHKDAFAFLVDSTLFSSVETVSSQTATNFNLYPNPSTGWVHLEFNKDQIPSELRMIHLSGQVVNLYKNIDPKMALDCSQFPNGVYILEASTSSGKMVQKLILQR